MAPMGALQFGNHNFVSIAACCVVTAQHESAGQRLSVTRYVSSGGARLSAGDQTPGDGKRPKTQVPESSIETSAGPIAVVWWGRLVKRGHRPKPPNNRCHAIKPSRNTVQAPAGTRPLLPVARR